MAPRRLETLRDAIFVEVDGESVPARLGEPLAVALAAAGRLTLGRSVKYHRPRGAACYRGRCDGCLMRVDGVQSVTTCRLPVRHSLTVETQNVIGSARRDLLAATDWFFPGGMNHHEMFTWNEQVNKVMQKVARRIAGIGTLPDTTRPAVAARALRPDALVVGGGPAGLSAAATLAEAGEQVVLVDEEPELGGSLLYWPERPRSDALRERRDSLVARTVSAGVTVLAPASVVGVYPPGEDVRGAVEFAAMDPERPVAVASVDGALVRILPRTLIVATGRAECASAFKGADRPSVIGLDAACVLMSYGVVPGERVVLAGEGAWLTPLARALEAAGVEVHGPFHEGALVEVEGRPTVERCDVLIEGRTRTLRCDAVVVATPRSAVFELAAQAGVEVRFSDDRYDLVADASDGRTAAPAVRVVGSAAAVTGLDDAIAHGRRAAEAVLA